MKKNNYISAWCSNKNASILSASVAIGRGDSWGEAVYVRIQNVGDLVATEAKYHHCSQIRCHQSVKLEKKNIGQPAGSVDSAKHLQR